MDKQTKVIDEIKQELLELGFNVDSKGIMYWIEAIKYSKSHPLEWEMLNVYEAVVEKNNSTVYRVERAMRVAINSAKENIQKKYGYYKPIKNQTYLNLIKFKLI